MLVRFCKGRDKPGSMVCVRDDGSHTWSSLANNFAYHDLLHYAFETTLGLRDSFFGMVARGVDIPAFAEPKERRTFAIPLEAQHTEFLVGALQIELVQGTFEEDLNAIVAQSCRQQGLPAPPEISREALEEVRRKARDLWQRWRELPPGGEIELEF